MKSFIRWTGNKTRYCKYLVKCIPNTFETYYEPFLGTGALFLHVEPTKWVINDINSDLINSWNIIRTTPGDLVREYKKYVSQFNKLSIEKRLEFCRNKTRTIGAMPMNSERAAVFIMMKHCSYMGNIVWNGKYYFPGLDHKLKGDGSKILTDNFEKNILHISKYINQSSGVIENKNYKDILANTKKNDFVFLDPPYIESHDYRFRYNLNELNSGDFMSDLVAELKKLDRRGVKWLLTQPNNQCVRNMFKNYRIKSYPVYRGLSDRHTKELMIMNY